MSASISLMKLKDWMVAFWSIALLENPEGDFSFPI
jgi:hypothetical protein